MIAELATPAEMGWSGPPPMAEAPSDGSPTRFFGYLKYHWVLIVFLGSLLAAGLAFAAWNLIPAQYTTYSLLRVSLRPEQVAFQTDETPSRNDFATYLKTQTQLIKSQYVLTAALREPGLAQLPMLKEQVDPVRFLEENLVVEYEDGSEIVRVGLIGESPEEIAQIVNAVQGAYFREIVEVEQRHKADRLQNLKDVQADMEKILNRSYEALRQTEQPLVVTDDGDVRQANQLALAQLNKLRDRLFQTDTEISTWQRRVQTLETQLAQFTPDAPMTEPVAMPTPEEIRLALQSDPRYQAADREFAGPIEELQSRLDYFLSITSNPNDPGINQLRERLGKLEADRAEFARTWMAQLQWAMTPMGTPMMGDGGRVQIQQELANARAELADREAIRELTVAAINEYESSLEQETAAPTPLQSPDFLKADIIHREELIHRIIDRAHLLELEVKAPPRVQPLQQASVPLKKDFKKQLLGTAFAGLLGFLVVGLGVVAYESRVRRVMSLKDVQRVAAGPVLGVVPLEGAGNEGSGNAPAWANSRQLTEAIDKARTQAILHAGPETPRTLLITSASTDEGQAFLTWKLTLSLAKAGYRTLLIDADLRSPAMHEYMGIPNDQGVCEALRGEIELRAAVQTLGDGLSFLPAGKWDDQVRQDLAGEKLTLLFGRLREHFDVIVVHAHPILSVTDTFLIGRHVDMTILTIQRHVTRLPLLGRAQERSLALTPDRFGVVYLGATTEEALI